MEESNLPVATPSPPTSEPEGGSAAPIDAVTAIGEGGEEFPNRYSIKETGEGRWLFCLEAPTLRVRVERGFSVTASAARQYAKGTIFLDGAAQGEPFLDVKRHVYNLDHHDGCVRTFTLATCEQALVLVRRGLDLRARDWTLYANEPDLDVILAIWVLFNHMRITGEDPEIRRKLTPLVRLEGCIDVHGLEMQDLCGFSPEVWRKTFAHLQALGQREAALKRSGEWGQTDLLEYAAETLRALDALLYSPLDFEQIEEVEELARAELLDRSLVIACKSDRPIYEVERALKKLYGDRLGILVMRKDERTYTLRQVDQFLPVSLDEIYEQLNLLDPAAGNRRSGNRWGGSADIGGSPRKSGSALTPAQITGACCSAFHRPSNLERLGRVGQAFLAASGVLLASWLTVYVPDLVTSLTQSRPVPDLAVDPIGPFAMIFALLASGMLLLGTRHGRGTYGLRLPVGSSWMLYLPLVVVGGLVGGAWLPKAAGDLSALVSDYGATGVVGIILLPLAAELLFRGVIFGNLMQAFHSAPAQRSKWFSSWPVIISSLLYVLATAVPLLSFMSLVGLPGFDQRPEVLILGACIFGFGNGLIRERSESLLPPVASHWVAAIGLLLWVSLVGG